MATVNETVDEIRSMRQARVFHPEPVPQIVVDQLLEVARWTGSSRNTQPWQFILVRDKAKIQRLSEARPPINWVAGGSAVIALVMDGADPESEGYDEGRLTERILIAAELLGYGGGTAWFMTPDEQQLAKETLNVPADKALRSVVVIGRPEHRTDPRKGWNPTGRKPMNELLSLESYGLRS